jgi:hypothetical protein
VRFDLENPPPLAGRGSPSAGGDQRDPGVVDQDIGAAEALADPLDERGPQSASAEDVAGRP